MAEKSRIGVWGSVPIALFHDKKDEKGKRSNQVNRNEIIAYAVLSSFQGTNANCFPGIPMISARANMSTGAIKKAIAGLIKKGWVERRKRFGKSNVYVVLVETLGIDEIAPYEYEEPGCTANSNDRPGGTAKHGPGDLAIDRPGGTAGIKQKGTTNKRENKKTLRSSSGKTVRTKKAKGKTVQKESRIGEDAISSLAKEVPDEPVQSLAEEDIAAAREAFLNRPAADINKDRLSLGKKIRAAIKAGTDAALQEAEILKANAAAVDPAYRFYLKAEEILTRNGNGWSFRRMFRGFEGKAREACDIMAEGKVDAEEFFRWFLNWDFYKTRGWTWGNLVATHTLKSYLAEKPQPKKSMEQKRREADEHNRRLVEQGWMSREDYEESRAASKSS